MKFSTILVALAAFAALAAGCDTRSLSPKVSTGTGNTGGSIGPGGAGGGGTFVPTRKLDMLFVIDDSPEVRLPHDNLIRNFPSFLTRLMDPPGLPDLHIAVISTDMGAGDGSIASCDATGGKNGVFQHTARGTCMSTGLDPGATYIADNGLVRNYTGNLADVFTCIAALGEQGCGFEHQFAATLRALGADGRPAPLENQGFLREDAYLVIIMLTNEDDCSAPASTFYDTTTNANLASPLGPAQNFRCNEFGHLCNGVKPPRLAPNGSVDDAVTLDGCVSAESAGMLIPVGDVVAALRTVKPFPDQQIVVAAIAGPPAPYTVHWHAPYVGTDTGPWPHMTHSCNGTDGSFADPSVRIAQWAGSYSDNGIFLSICDTNWAPSLDRIAALLSPSAMPTP